MIELCHTYFDSLVGPLLAAGNGITILTIPSQPAKSGHSTMQSDSHLGPHSRIILP
jgi:hypothetical protein